MPDTKPTIYGMNVNGTIYDLEDKTAREDTGTVTSVNDKTGAVVLTASDVGALPSDTNIPKKTSDLQNDSGFITASGVPVTKVNNKTGDVTLSASDVGAIPNTVVVPTKTSQLTNDSGYITSASVPSKTSQLTNDIGFITSSSVPVRSVNNQTGAITLDASDVGALPDSTKYVPYTDGSDFTYDLAMTFASGTFTTLNMNFPGHRAPSYWDNGVALSAGSESSAIVYRNTEHTAAESVAVAMGYGAVAQAQKYASSDANRTYTGLNGTAVALGDRTIAHEQQTAVGIANKECTNSTDVLFVVGAGDTNSSRKNAFRVNHSGAVYGLSSYNSSGADYAEYFEWDDGNPNDEDRVGYFVTLNGDKLVKANKNDYILGVISGLPCIIGNADEDWMGRWQRDEFGRFKYGNYTVIDIKKDPETEEEIEYEKEVYGILPNPDYLPSQNYVERKDRKEWSAVGMMGVLSVRDDGTCQVNGFCDVADGGTATAGNTYRVIERVSDNVVKIIFR